MNIGTSSLFNQLLSLVDRDDFRHLGMDGAPGRSTLSYANAHRPHELFEKLYYQLLGKVSEGGQELAKASA